jgi:transcriptional regulator with XRE-family HTH domain
MTEQPALEFGRLLRQLLAGAKLTQEELAEAASLSPRSVSDLERGINRTARRDTAVLLAGAPGRKPAWPGCPYLGLVPFGERDERLFYGRGELVDQLVRWVGERLGRPGILLVAGESGAGKSSLLRAGLLPQLAAGVLGPGSRRWPRRVIQPAGGPVRELAMQLADLAGVDPASVYRSLSAVSAAPPRLVLVIDEFEELFTAGRDSEGDRAERDAFVAALDAGPFTVGPMSEAELRLAVTGPAAEAGLAVEPALAEAVIAELREGTAEGLGSGALPLMSQAMAATWEHREGRELTLRGYRRTGGVADAVNRGAQAAYDALTSTQQDAARLVFTQLTIVTAEGQLARRRCRITDLHAQAAELAADIDAVLDSFSARRLLVLGQDHAEISHDVLLHSWKQLRDWLGDDQLDRALYGQVVSDAQTWDLNGRDSSYLYRPGRLAAVDATAARWQHAPTRYLPLPAIGTAFLGAAQRRPHESGRPRHDDLAGGPAATRQRDAVKPGHRAAQPRSPPRRHQPGRQRERGGVRPGRHVGGRRLQRRHRANLASIAVRRPLRGTVRRCRAANQDRLDPVRPGRTATRVQGAGSLPAARPTPCARSLTDPRGQARRLSELLLGEPRSPVKYRGAILWAGMCGDQQECRSRWN